MATNGNGLRVQKVAGGTTTVYIFSGSKVIAEYTNGAAPSSPSAEYVYGGGALIAKFFSSGPYYYHQDHLSNRMLTDSSGNDHGEVGHFPFGESWYNPDSVKWNFTTYEYDSESGNHYAQARYHISRLGRLLSPDPIAGSIANPQSLNRYSYSVNDPANVTDPSGALPGCPYSVEAKPRDKSQQTSGDPPSVHSDTSDGDIDSEDADADPPQQDNCYSHTNPFGGGEDGTNLDYSDVSDLITTSPGIFGSGQSIGYIGTTGYVQGEFSIGGIDYEQQRCGPDLAVAGLCSYAVQGIPVLPLNAMVTAARTAAAVQRALEALANPDCASLFANGVDPAQLLTALADGSSGAITNQDLGTGGLTVVANTQGILSPTIPTWNGDLEHAGPVWSGANITVNSNPSSPFNAGWADATLFGAPVSPNYSDADLNAATLIHELGHAANFIFGPGSSAVLYDQGQPVVSEINTNLVLKHCF